MALPIINDWKSYFTNPHEGLGSSYERIILNKLLLMIKNRYYINSVIEVPVFGFTGLTGLNSYALYQKGCDVVLLDHDFDRINMMNSMFLEMNSQIEVKYSESYNSLPFADASYDMGWNFSALWFTDDVSQFLSELTRITAKVILICVPNKSGLGYKWQKANTKVNHNVTFHEEFVEPDLIREKMEELKWVLIGESFIDCPPWPDIGMSKEKLLGNYLSKFKLKVRHPDMVKPISILDYYQGKDTGFAQRLEKYAILENYAPESIKKYWAHHRWMLFEPSR